MIKVAFFLNPNYLYLGGGLKTKDFSNINDKENIAKFEFIPQKRSHAPRFTS